MRANVVVWIAGAEVRRSLRAVPLLELGVTALAIGWAGSLGAAAAVVPALAMLVGATGTWRALRDGTVGALVLEPVRLGEVFAGLWLGLSIQMLLVSFLGLLAAGAWGAVGLALLAFPATIAGGLAAATSMGAPEGS